MTNGIEREWFIFKDSLVYPGIDQVLPVVREIALAQGIPENHFGYELFAGQIEDRSGIAENNGHLLEMLVKNETVLKMAEKELSIKFKCMDFIHGDLIKPYLKVNSFDDRHAQMWVKLDEKRKIAASQVAALHVHVGVTIEQAVVVLNYCRLPLIRELGKIGDFSNGQRLAVYSMVANTNGEPPVFADKYGLLKYIKDKGHEKNVLDLVRYKPSTGTVEFRMFGATSESVKINLAVEAAQKIVNKALEKKAVV